MKNTILQYILNEIEAIIIDSTKEGTKRTGDYRIGLRKAQDIISNHITEDVIKCHKCGSENEYSQGYKQNIRPTDDGDWRIVAFNICDSCGNAIDVYFWD